MQKLIEIQIQSHCKKNLIEPQEQSQPGRQNNATNTATIGSSDGTHLLLENVPKKNQKKCRMDTATWIIYGQELKLIYSCTA